MTILSNTVATPPRRGRFISISATLLSTLSVVALAAPAAAQDAPAPNAATPAAPAPSAAAPVAPAADAQTPEAAAPQSMEDIIVFGRHRAETVYASPLAVTALNADTLKQQSVSQITDLSRVAPNVLVRESSSGAGAVEVLIRGQVTAIANPAVDSPVGIYYDDVYIAQTKGAIGGAFDLSSVEVARGVQGTLSGRNNTGGAIRFYTNKPELGVFSGEGSFSLGTHDLHRESLILNVPVGDKLAVRIGVSDSYRGPLGRSLITGIGTQEVNQQLLRASALWQPSSALSLNVVYEKAHIRSLPVNFHTVRGNIANAVIACTQGALNPSGACYPASVVIPSDIHDNSANGPIKRDRIDTDFIRGTANWKLAPGLDAKVVVGYRELTALAAFDVDTTPSVSTYVTNFGALSKQLTVEPQLTAELFDNKLTLVGGYYYFRDDAQQLSTAQAGFVSGGVAAYRILPLDDKLTNISNAGYLHGELKLARGWTVAGGVRYTDDKRTIQPRSEFDNSDPRSVNYPLFQAGLIAARTCNVTQLVGGVSVNLNPTGPCPIVRRSASFNYWSYEASTRFEITDNVAVYARTGRGQKSGGFNSPYRSISQAPFLPEQVTDYEVGIKTRGLFDNMLNLNIAVYTSDYQNMQRYTSSLTVGGSIASLVFNVGSARIRGVEADFTFKPAQALTFSGYFGYTDAKYKKFNVTDAAGVVYDLSGQTFYQTPKVTARLGAVYEVHLSHGSLKIGGGWNFQSSSSLYLFTYSQFTQKAYSLFDARITYSPSAQFDVSLWGTNLADKKYAQGATVSPVSGFNPSAGFNSGALVPGESRVIGLTGTVHF